MFETAHCMKIAFTADWLPTFAGAEHVIAEFHALWPSAPLFTSIANHGKLGPLDSMDIRTGPLQRWYRLLRRHQILLPWMPRAVERIDLRGYDLVISSSHAVGKGIIPANGARHVCYCHTPVRYAWEMEKEYLRDFRVPKILLRSVKRELTKLRRWDMTTAKRVDVFIANSRTTQERIRRIYDRDSVVIQPPVGSRFFSAAAPASRPYYLAIGRLVPYKRFDLLIETANRLRLPLRIAGDGHDRRRLRKLAGPTVELLGFVPDSDLPGLYAGARALLLPQFEDAGVVSLEAQASGTPVIAYGKGGALDTIKDGVTGVFFDEQAPDALEDALARFGRIAFDPARLRAHTEKFSSQRFREKMERIVKDTLNGSRSARLRAGTHSGVQARSPAALEHLSGSSEK